MANLERQVIKQQFQKVVKPPTMPFGPVRRRIVGKQKKGNTPAVVPITAVTGDKKLPFQYTAGKTRVYNRPTEAEIRDQRGKTAALAANDGLTPAQGGGSSMVNELAAMRKCHKNVLWENNECRNKKYYKGCMQRSKAHLLRAIQTC